MPARHARRSGSRRPRLGVVKFASCDGCQLTLLDLEDELLALAERFEIVEFAEATHATAPTGRTTSSSSRARSAPRSRPRRSSSLRRQTTLLVTIGACATAGGIQALRNWARPTTPSGAAVYAAPRVRSSRWPSRRRSPTTSRSTPSCAAARSIRRQLVELLTALIVGRRPQLPDEAVCLECKRRAAVCVVVAGGFACLGPVTRTGCGALCPAYGRGCYGCFGPREQANADGLARPPPGRRGPRAGRRRPAVRRVHRLRASRSARSSRSSAGWPRRASLPAAGRPGSRTMHDTLIAGRSRRACSTSDGSPASRARARSACASADGVVEEARLAIFEAPRYFERLVVGRTPDEVIDIVARICGICPIAYQMSAVHAFEDLFGVEIDPEVRRAAPAALLRRVDREPRPPRLPAPRSRTSSATRAPSSSPATTARRSSRRSLLKRTGNRLVKLLGGRPIHPISVRVGGFSRVPRRSELEALRPELEAAVAQARATLDLVTTLDVPEYEREPRLVALRHPTEYPFNDGRIVSNDGIDLRPSDWRDGLPRGAPGRGLERAPRPDRRRRGVPARARRAGRAGRRAAPSAGGRGARARPGWPRRIRRNPFWSIAARAIELIHATAEALDIVDGVPPAGRPSRPLDAAPGRRGLGDRGPARPPLPPLRGRRAGPDRGRPDRPADEPEPGRDRGRPACRSRRTSSTCPTTEATHPARAADPELRPVHLVRHPLPGPVDRAEVTR